MLCKLSITNYALIDTLDIEFSPGLNVLTGETGAGKTIIIGALGLVLGTRASSTVIRKGTPKCTVIAEFEISPPTHKRITNMLVDTGIDISTKLTIRRELNSDGKNRCYLNDKLINLSLWEQVSRYLVNIHGQHSQQTLLDPEGQRNILDAYAGLTDLVNRVSDKFQHYAKIKKEKEQLFLSEQERNQKIDLYQYQIQEINNANLELNEEEISEQEYVRLNSAEKLNSLINEIYSYLFNEETSILVQLQKATRLVNQLTAIDGTQTELNKSFTDTLYNLESIIDRVREYRRKIEFNPKRLEEIADRRELVKRLKKKYGTTIPEILSYRDKISSELAKLTQIEETRTEVDIKLTQAKDELVSFATNLSTVRKKAAGKLKSEVEKELKELGMSNAEFHISIETRKDNNGEIVYDSTGQDQIEFYIAPNPGEGLNPVTQIASGGELSRIMLALDTVFARVDTIPTLIFDEIDTGIGGSMGTVVGDKLFRVAKSHQVLCITHLPQIAVFGNLHWQVCKETINNRTRTIILPLDSRQRVDEIARMFGGGKKPTPAIIAHVRELLTLNSKMHVQ